jgi:hypothetical protein
MEHLQKSISQTPAAKVSQPTQQVSEHTSTFQFKDNRPEASAQLNIQALADHSKASHSSLQLKTIIGNSENPIQKKSNTTGMPDKLKSGVENLSGLDMSDVKVHYNSSQPAQLNAHAYAQGTSIHIAPGQEKHLPHEAWHVVQQKQGRVRPTLQMKQGVAVNDDKGLEKEADVMGAKALSTPMGADFAMLVRTLPQSSLLTNQLMIQRSEIKTLGGTFKTKEYALTFHSVKEGGEKGVGCKMNLEFHANDTVNCAKIGLTQTTTPTYKKEAGPTESYAAPRGKNRATSEIIEGDNVDEARYVDRTDQNIHPVFGAENPKNEPKLVPESFHSEQDKLGTHELNEYGEQITNEPAALMDEPGRDWTTGWFVKQSFETTALCLSGPMKGDYLGSVEWGYQYGVADAGLILPLKLVSLGLPSKIFMDAVNKWNKAKINQSPSPDRETVKLPEQERIGTDEALSLPHRKHMLDTIDTLGENAVLNLLADPVFSEHSKQLLWRRLSNLMGISWEVFMKSWSEAIQLHPGLRPQLEKFRDSYAKQHWGLEEWIMESDVLVAIELKEEDTQANIHDLFKLLNDVKYGSLFIFLNPGYTEETVIKKNDKFKVPSKLCKEL